LKYKSFDLPKDFYIFAIIIVKIIYFRQKVNRMGFNTILSGLKRKDLSGSADKGFLSRLNKFYKASTFLLTRVFKDPNPCMIRSLILYGLCDRYNIKASLMTGVAKNAGVLTGHSWLEIGGEPVNENKEFIKSFTVIYEK
jgi:transglutaminase superfamily protein